jgi:uncharacterized protein (TIGR00255 family)
MTQLQSMTGFGKANGHFQDKKISIEIRSLNSKGLDLNLKIPAAYRSLETEIRRIIGAELLRGKVDFGIYVESQAQQHSGFINRRLADQYFQELKSINQSWESNTTDYLSLVLRMPDVLSQELNEVSEEEAAFILQLSNEACMHLQQFRTKEGQNLIADFTQNLEIIRAQLQEIAPFESERLQQVRERIFKGLSEIDESRLDQNRLEQELIYYIEKLDIAEEKMRLQHHMSYFHETMQLAGSGKKLGFITQEMGREINTLGSKCNHAEIQRRVVIMKDHLEKMKEQVLNTL